MDNQLANLCGDKRETSLHVNDVTAEGNETFICLNSYRRKGVTCLPSTIALRSLIEHDVGIRAKSLLFIVVVSCLLLLCFFLFRVSLSNRTTFHPSGLPM